jgi:hypothetical protein
MPVFPLKTRRTLCAAFGGALGVVLMLGAAPARAQDLAPEEMLDSLMGMVGLSRVAKPGIDYRERSPLVIPKGDTLPPPASSKVADPNWPVDPEIKEARRIAAEQKASDGRTGSQLFEDRARPMLPSELAKGRTTRAQSNQGGGERDNSRLSLSELGYKGGIFDSMFSKSEEHPTSFTGEAPRTSLITPPSGYQTPSPAQPYASGKASVDTARRRTDTFDPKYEKY